MPQCLVSVVIQSRDRTELLHRAIRSIEEQHYPEIEIVVIDNASTVPLEAGSLLTRHPVRALRNETLLNLAENRNLGWHAATGDIVCFLDDDDTYRPEKIADVVERMAARPDLDFVWGMTEHIDQDGKVMVTSHGPNDICRFLQWRYVHCNALAVRRDLRDEIQFSPEMEIYVDVEFVGRLMRAYKGEQIDRVHAVWNRDDRRDQITQRNLRRAKRNWARLCDTFDAEIRSDHALRRLYHRKMLILAVLFLDPVRAFRSLRLAV